MRSLGPCKGLRQNSTVTLESTALCRKVGESSKVLDVCLRFDSGSGNRGMDSRRGLGSGESVDREGPEGHAFDPAAV